MPSKKLRHPSLIMTLFAIAVTLMGVFLVNQNAPDSLLFPFVVPVVIAAFFYKRMVYTWMTLFLAAVAIWVVYHVSSDLRASLWTIAFMTVTCLTLGEAIYYLSTSRQRALLAEREHRLLAETLTEVTLTLTSQTDSKVVLDEIIHQARRLVAFKSANVALLQGEVLHCAAWYGYDSFGVEDEVLANLVQPLSEFTIDAESVQTRSPVIIADAHKDARWVIVEGNEWIRSHLLVPICLRDQVLGVLRFDDDRPNAFTMEDAQRLTSLANAAAIAIENSRLLREAQQHVAALELLQRASLQVTSTFDLSEILDTINESALILVDGTNCHIYFYDQTADEFAFASALWKDGRRAPAVQTLRPQGITATVAHSGQPVIINDASRHPLYQGAKAEKWGVKSIVGFPLKRVERVLGVFTIAFLDKIHVLTQEELQILNLLADQAVIAIENAQLYRDLRAYTQDLEQRVADRTVEVQAQYAQLEAILNSTADGILVTNAEGELVQVNQVAQAWLDETLRPQHADELRAAVRDLTAHASERPKTLLEFPGLALALQAAPITTPGAAAMMVVAAHDVSYLRAVDRMRTNFIEGVSHELRTPVTTIKLYADLMKRRPEQIPEYLERLSHEAEHQVQLVENIVRLSRVDAAKLPYDFSMVALNTLARETVERHLLMMDRTRRVQIAFVASPVDPWVYGASEQMQFLLHKLLENAVQYTPADGQVTVSVGQVEVEHKIWGTLSVQDTGIGIPPEELPHIFERFYQHVQTHPKGTTSGGLGLAIVKELVELHSGFINVESEVGMGSTFTVYLPLAPQEQPQAQECVYEC